MTTTSEAGEQRARGAAAIAAAMRREAQELGKRVQALYVDGKGIWKCRLPDGSYNEVHHCYDFGTTLMNIGRQPSPVVPAVLMCNPAPVFWRTRRMAG